MLKFKIVGQRLTCAYPLVVGDTINYLSAEFSFSEEWEGLDVWAHFRKGNTVYDFQIVGGIIPKEANLHLEQGQWDVYVHGIIVTNGTQRRITTSIAVVDVQPCGVLNGQPLPPISPTAEEQISWNAAEALRIARSVRDDADAGEFDGEDGKSAYESAQDGGYTGTEQQFNSDLADVSNKIEEAPEDGKQYARQDGTWSEVEAPSGGDMETSVYDPQGKETDIFAYADSKDLARIALHSRQVGGHSWPVGSPGPRTEYYISDADFEILEAHTYDRNIVLLFTPDTGIGGTQNTGIYNYACFEYNGAIQHGPKAYVFSRLKNRALTTITIDGNDKTVTIDTVTVPASLSDLSDDSTHRLVTDEEKETWGGKQDAIDDLAEIRSGAALGATAVQPAEIVDMATQTWVEQQGYDTEESVDAKVSVVQDNVDDIAVVIPAQASAQNQLADKEFVNSSVQTATANFRGNWDNWATVPNDARSYPQDYAGTRTPTTNDYMVVADASDVPYTDPQTQEITYPYEGTWRFKYGGVWATDGKNGWNAEYQVNETPLTAAQLAALNSGITEELVARYNGHVENSDIHVTAAQKTTWNGKQNAISDLAEIRSGAAAGATALQSETDPTVPSWAKQTTKPAYTAAEVGARADTWVPSKGDVGLGNVANERQYSADNPPPYPVADVQLDGESIVSDGVAELESEEAELVDMTGNVPTIYMAPYQGVDLTVKFASEIANYSSAWAWIKSRIQAGDYDGLRVCDWIPFTANGNTYHAQIAGIDTYTGYGDSGHEVGHHIDFISKEVWETAHAYNKVNYNNGLSTQKSPWLASDLYHFCNSLSGNVPNGTTLDPATVAVDYTSDGIYYYLPQELKDVIVQKRLNTETKYSASGLLNAANYHAWENVGYLWLPTEMETIGVSIYGSASHSAAMGPRTYPVFKNVLFGNTRIWQLLNVSYVNATHVIAVRGVGIVDYVEASTNYLSIPVCFRIA